MKTAFVFPGQGSQSLGMLADVASRHPTVLDTFKEASDAIGLDLWGLAQEGAEAEINRTEVTQPLILAASVSLWRLWRELEGRVPDFVAGHSLGEYSALVAAEVMSLSAAAALVHERGKLMQAAVPEGVGAMAAVIGLDDDKVISACRQAAAGDIVEAVNFNSPGQVVIAGHKAAVERASIVCKESGARRIMPLPVSVPSHCALMQEAAHKLARSLEKIAFNEPVIPIYQNVSADQEMDPGKIRANLVKQLYTPVLWTQTLTKMADAGVGIVVECGPGKVLSGLCKRIVDGLQTLPLGQAEEIEKALAVSKGEVME